MKSLRITNLRVFFDAIPELPFNILKDLEDEVLKHPHIIEKIALKYRFGEVVFLNSGFKLDNGIKKIYYEFVEVI